MYRCIMSKACANRLFLFIQLILVHSCSIHISCKSLTCSRTVYIVLLCNWMERFQHTCNPLCTCVIDIMLGVMLSRDTSPLVEIRSLKQLVVHNRIFQQCLLCYAVCTINYLHFVLIKEVTLKLPGRNHHRVIKTQIKEHEAWKLQQVCESTNCVSCVYIVATDTECV